MFHLYSWVLKKGVQNTQIYNEFSLRQISSKLSLNKAETNRYAKKPECKWKMHSGYRPM